MARDFIPTVYAANDLSDGDSVYLSAEGWVRDIAHAEVAMNADEDAVIGALARAGLQANRVVDVYAVAVSLGDGRPWPVLRREQIKASRATTIPVGPATRLSDAA